MSFKLLVAACCLLAAAQARPPKPPTTSCSVACVSRTFWTGYQVGKVYSYEFEQKVEISSELSASQISRLRLTGLAKVEVVTDCELGLTVEVKETQVGDIDDADSLSPREAPSKMLDALRLPLRFSYENGQISHLCPAEGETRASLNVKRGLLSQLQVSTEQRGQAHQLEERDILGDCWTEYTPEGPNTLLKTKDLSKCKKLNYQVYPLSGVKSFDDEKLQSKLPVTKGSLRCRIEIDSERDIVKETVCTEEQSQSADHGSESVEDKIRTSTRLSLKTEASGLVSALHEVTERTDLRHAHKTSKQCHSSSAWVEEDLFHSANECVERKHGSKTSAENRAQAKKTLEDLCEATKATQGMTREVPKKYADLIKYLRGVTEQEDLNQLYKWVSDGYCSENPLLKAIMRSAIPTVGTKQSVSLILDQLSKSQIEGAPRDNWLINGIALMREPTQEILPELLNYVKKRREDALLGVTRDEPLALSAVVHKICQEQPDCESDPKVKAVIDYFSDSLGPACEELTKDADDAFVAMLAVGNMGRVSGGSQALIRCASSATLPTVFRVFALHSLRRFAEFSAEAKDQLVELLLDQELDSELRIAAYQALSRHGFNKSTRLHQAIRRLLNNLEDDRHVQMFVYTHVKNLRGEAASQMEPTLRGASTIGELEKLSRRQYSNSLRAEYFSDNLGVGAQAEVPIIFSAKSALPRYIGLNLTVNMPSQGQSINLMEIGLRMQGIDRLFEELYSRIAKKFSPEVKPTSSQPRPPATDERQSELTTEQHDSLKKTSSEPRIDLLVRRYGVELWHSDISGGMLESIPTIADKADYKALVKMFAPAASDSDGPIGLSAGTLVENTLSIPTIAGLTILVKKELHYLTNLRVETQVRPEAKEAALDLKPSAAVLMSRTVAVDAVFERAGIQSRTTYLTSTGLRLSLKKSLEASADSQFYFKIEPLVKKQNVADAKTEVSFFHHTAGKVHVEKPLTPQQSSITREKCFEGHAKKYTGHKICYSTEYLPSCKKSLRSFCQCPGSYQIFAEKSDDFGGYEVGFSLRNEAKSKKLEVLLGDRKSKDRLLKFNAQMVSEGDRTGYKLEFLNPIFPIVLDSNVTKDSGSYRVYSEVQAGSVQYVASGLVQPQSDDGVKVEGEIYPKEKLSQKMKVSLEHKFTGISPLLLPLATCKLQVKMHTGNQLSLEYNVKHENSKFTWLMNSQYKTSKGDLTSMHYRVQWSNKFEEGVGSSVIFLYDLEVQNPKGNNLAHSLHTKMIRRTEGGSRQTTATVNHKLQYGAEKKRSPVEFEARISLKEAVERNLLHLTGDGELTYLKSGEPVTAKLENLKVQIGEAVDTTDGFDKQRVYAISYSVKFEETSVNYQAEIRHLHWKRWTWTQQAFEIVAKAKLGAKSYNAQLKHSLNGPKYQARQVAKIEYYDDVYLLVDHKMYKVEGAESIKNEFNLLTPKGNKVQAKWGVTWPEQNTMNCDMVVEVNDKKWLGSRQALRFIGSTSDQRMKHEMTLEMPPSSYNLETDFRISRQSATDLADFLNYQVRLITGRYSPRKSFWMLATLLWDLSLEQSTKLVGPTATQRAVLENVIDWSNDGVMWKNLLQVNIQSRDILNHGVTLTRIRQFSDSRSWNFKEGLKLEVKALDKSLTTEMESGWYKSSGKYRSMLKIASKDTWETHDFKMELANKKEARTWESLVKTEGHIKQFPITSTANVTLGGTLGQGHIVLTVTNPGSKLHAKMTQSSSPLQLTADMNLDGDFGLLPVKEMKAVAEFNLREGISFESNAEVDGAEIARAKLSVKKRAFVADVKTAHPLLQEIGIKSVMQADTKDDAVKFDTIIKFAGLNRRMQIKKTGTVKLNYNSPVYSLLFVTIGNIEFVGFEELMSYKKLEYDVMLKKKPGMEFQFVTSVSSPDSSAKVPILYLTSGLNYWPIKAELQLKTRLPQINYGFRAEVDYTSAFVGYLYKSDNAAVTYEVQDRSENVKAVKIRVDCSFCTPRGDSLIDGQANMSWPLKLSEFELGLDARVNSRALSRITFRFVHRPAKKQILAALDWSGRTHKLIDCSYTQAVTTDGARGGAVLHSDLRIFLGKDAQAKVQANFEVGKDNQLDFGLTWANSDTEVLKGKIFWLSAPRSFDSIPVVDIDGGLQLKGFGADAYVVHKSQTGKSCEWRLSVNYPNLREPITARLEVTDGKLKSGKISAFDRELLLSTSSDGSIQATLRSNSDEAKTLRVKWSGSYEGKMDFKGKLEVETESNTNVFEVKVQPQIIVINYGRSTAPNVLKIEYEASELKGLWDTMAELKVSHVTDVEKNSELTLLPGIKIPIPTTHYPFKMIISAKPSVRSLAITFEAASLGVKSMYYKHDLTEFPRTFNAEGNLISSEETNKIWEMNIKVDKDVPTVEALWKISDIINISFKEPKIKLKIKDKIDLTIQLPMFMTGQGDSDKKEMAIQVSLPVLKIDEPFNLKATLQSLTEGRQITIKYGRGEDDKIIVWSLTAWKFSLTRRFENFQLDCETSLISKVALLASWQIRSVEARIEINKDTLSDGDSFTAKYKTTLKVNGEDFSTTALRLEGKKYTLPNKIELTMTGYTESTLKFDSGKEDTPTEIRFSLNKFGSSRDKYAMKLDVSPRKTNSWFPDFQLETECPQRQFVIGKECTDTAGESSVAVQLYLNKKMDHGVKVAYKAESPTSGIPRYTIEVDLPTRKIRAVCQPEIASKKFGVMTTIDWDADKSTDKMIGLDTRVDFSSDVLVIVDCKAPFLTSRLRVEGRFQNKENGFGVQLKHMKGESEVFSIRGDFSYQRQAQTDVARVTFETTGAVESKIILTTQVAGEIEDFRRSRIDGTLKIKVHTWEKNLKFLYRSLREITISCDHGASLSLKHSTDGKNMHQLILFVSDNDKQAARLNLVLSKPLCQITVKLDVGSGSFNNNSDLRGPNYRPESVLMRAVFNYENQGVSAVAFVGKMMVGQKLSPEASVPSHLSFFTFGVKMAEYNKIKFRVNWRVPSKVQCLEVVRKVKTSISSFVTGSTTTVVDAFDFLKVKQRTLSPTINSAWIVEELSSLASNDVDKFVIYIQRATDNNEFYLKNIRSAASAVTSFAKMYFATAVETARRLKDIVGELGIVEKFTGAAQNLWNSAAALCERCLDKISFQKIMEISGEYFDSTNMIAKRCLEKVILNFKSYAIGVYAMMPDLFDFETTELLKSTWGYFDSLSSLTSTTKYYAVQIWSQTRSIFASCIVGAKSLVADDLLPLAVNHLDDLKTVKDIYDSLVLELRIWYDRGATPDERTALTRTSKFLSYLFSEDTLNNWLYMTEGCKLILRGDYNGGLKKLFGQYGLTTWRPVCDTACMRGESFAAVEGYVYQPNYITIWPMIKAPVVVLKRIGSKMRRQGLPEASLLSAVFGSTVGVWNPVERLLTVRHRTAVIAGDHQLITFDGQALTHERPCNYLVAQEFPRGLFSIVQEYRKMGARQVRDRLRVRFGTTRITVNRDGSLQLNDKTERLPLKRMTESGKTIEAVSAGDSLTVRFHASLRNTLVIRCSSAADSCVISVHPLFQGSVHGLAGSNDGRKTNDIHKRDAKEHVKFWTAGQCIADGSASVAQPEIGSSSGSSDCFAWFRMPISPLATCFQAVDPEPYLNICQRQERLGRDPCAATRQYAERCSSESIRISTPTKCEACRLDSDGEIARAGLVTDKKTLQKRIQVLFLIEDSACGLDAVGTGGSRIRSLASMIDRLKTANANLKTAEFGLATYGGSESPSSPVSPLSLSKEDDEATNRLFGSLAELGDALTRLQLTGSSDDTAASTDILRAVAALPEHYQWRPLAQKHLVVVACKPCTAKSWNFASLFAKAQRSVKDQIFVHTISKTAIRPERVFPDIVGYDAQSYHRSDWTSVPLDSLSVGSSRRLARTECSAELATESDTSAKGSVWRLEKFASRGEESSQTMQLLVNKEIQRHLDSPKCRKCSCSGGGRQQGKPWCRIVKSDTCA